MSKDESRYEELVRRFPVLRSPFDEGDIQSSQWRQAISLAYELGQAIEDIRQSVEVKDG